MGKEFLIHFSHCNNLLRYLFAQIMQFVQVIKLKLNSLTVICNNSRNFAAKRLRN